MVGIAQRIEPALRVDDHRFGRRELGTRVDGPAERLRIDPETDAGSAVWLHFRLDEEIARVDEAEADRLAVLLGRRRPPEQEKRIVLVAGGSTRARDRLAAGLELACVDVPLTCPASAQVHELPVGVGQVDGSTHGDVRANRLLALVAHAHAAGDDRQVPEDRVRQGHRCAAGSISEVDGRPRIAGLPTRIR